MMEGCGLERSESLMASIPLWSDSWGLCNVANSRGSLQIEQISGVMYIAFPASPSLNSLGNLVDLNTAGDTLFSGISTTLNSDETPPMVDGDILNKFLDHFEFDVPKIKEDMEMQRRNLMVVTGHGAGGAVAALTTLCLISAPSPPCRVICITFGSPLLGNQSFSSLISRSGLHHNFCHVVSIHDLVPGLLLSPPLSPDLISQISSFFGLEDKFLMSISGEFYPFGTYLFCSDNGVVRLDDAASVRKVLLLLSTEGTPLIEDHLRYGHYVSTYSQQFLKYRSFLSGNISENSDDVLTLESLGFSHQKPGGVAPKECIETTTRAVCDLLLISPDLNMIHDNVLPSRHEIEWYKDHCDASYEQLGYYDFFKRGSLKRDYRINLSRQKLGNFWDNFINMLEKNKVPLDFDIGKKWVYQSHVYQLLVEPLDIANFYKHRDLETCGHYLEQGNRPKRYKVMDKWWKQRGENRKTKGVQSRFKSATQDSCFWAKLEEAKEYLDEIRKESRSSDPQRILLLLQKIVGFERYSGKLVEHKEISIDVLAKNSSYSVWVKNLKMFRTKFCTNGFDKVIDEIAAMAT